MDVLETKLDRTDRGGLVHRRDSEYVGRRMLKRELPGRRQRGRPKRRSMDVLREDMQFVW